MAEYILALDQGTTSSRAILFDRSGCPATTAQREISQSFPNPSWVEHNPEEIFQSQIEVAKQAIDQAGISPEQIAAIGITNQRETTIIWDRKTGQCPCRAIVWQDRRTASRCEQLASESERIRAITGLQIDSYFSATKMEWLLNHAGRSAYWAVGTVDTYLLWRLTTGNLFLTDASNASRTMLFDIRAGDWSEELLELFGVPRSALPDVVSSSQIYGTTSVFGPEIPIASLIGDQQSATFGQCCFEPGMAKNTYGTGCFALMNTGTEAKTSGNRLLTTVAWQLQGRPQEFALEGSVFVAGAAIQWLRDEMKLIETAAQSEAVAMSVPNSAGVQVVPAFVGLGAPYWDPHSRGTIVGITRGTSGAHIVRATLESIAFQTRDVMEAMNSDSGVPLRELRVDGGASSNDFLMQFEADILGVPVIRPACTESTALGAAYLAGLAVGFWSSQSDLSSLSKVDRIFEPKMSADERESNYALWQNAVKTCQTWRAV